MTATARTEEDREFAAITESEIWTEARDRLAICEEAESDNRTRAKEAILFREGDQWEPNPQIAEDEIERRGMRARYTVQLLDSLNYTASMDGFWLILTATPAQRCKAMLAAVREC